MLRDFLIGRHFRPLKISEEKKNLTENDRSGLEKDELGFFVRKEDSGDNGEECSEKMQKLRKQLEERGVKCADDLNDKSMVDVQEILDDLEVSDDTLLRHFAARVSGDFAYKVKIEKELWKVMLDDHAVRSQWESLLTKNYGKSGIEGDFAPFQYPQIHITVPPSTPESIISDDELNRFVHDSENVEVLLYPPTGKAYWHRPDVRYPKWTFRQFVVCLSAQFDLSSDDYIIKKAHDEFLKILRSLRWWFES
jgi:hypothetical protein